MNALSLERRDPAGGLDVEREIQSQRAGMEQVERPQVHRAARQIGAAGRLSNDGWTAGGITELLHALFVSRPMFAVSCCRQHLWDHAIDIVHRGSVIDDACAKAEFPPQSCV